MTTEIIHLGSEDFEEAMDFMDLAFGEHSPHDFAQLLPSVYRPTEQHMACNHAIRADGRIEAVVGMYPIPWRAGSIDLRIAGIGGVCTHRRRRGRGHMRALMEHCVADMREQEYDFSWLGGQRQRYRRYGYDKCGCSCSISVNEKNVRGESGDEMGLRFERLEEGDSERLTQARLLHDAQIAHVRRPPEDFHRYLRSWRAVPHMALDGEGNMVGYLAAGSRGDSVLEMVTGSDAMLSHVAQAWVAQHGAATFHLPPWFPGAIRLLSAYGETVSVGGAGSCQVFDWVRVTDALMKLRRQCGPMIPGCVTVSIAGEGLMALEVGDETAGASWLESSTLGGDADVAADATTTMRLLFGPLRPSEVMELSSAAGLLESWCPLPLGWTRQDGV